MRPYKSYIIKKPGSAKLHNYNAPAARPGGREEYRTIVTLFHHSTIPSFQAIFYNVLVKIPGYILITLFFCMICSQLTMAAEFDIKTYADRYRAYDQNLNGGKGYSTSRDSGELAWGESYILNDYFMLYRVTRDSYWLDKMVQHIDAAIYTMTGRTVPGESFTAEEIDAVVKELISRALATSMTALDPYGYPLWMTSYPGWSATKYSAAMARVTYSQSKMANIKVSPERIIDLDVARTVTGHEYQIYFGDSHHFGLTDLKLGYITMSWVEFTPGVPITVIPGVPLHVEWEPQKGDTFNIKTIEQKPLQFVAHDGMMLYPIARFIECVTNDNSLQERYAMKARIYKSLIMEVFAQKWERYWVEFDNGAGTYKSTESPAEIYPNWLLPLNQNNALGRAFLVMQDKKVSDNILLRNRSRQMALYFRNFLRPMNQGWTWNYREAAEPGMELFAEDTSHAITDVGFAVEACHRGVIFTQDDMRRFALTLLQNMWNGSMDAPEFGYRVNMRGGNGWYYPNHARHWIELCEFEPQVWDVCRAWFRKSNEPVEFIPSLLYGQDIYTKR